MDAIQLLQDAFHQDNMPNGKSVYIYEHDGRYEVVLKACNDLDLKYMNRDKRIVIEASGFESLIQEQEPVAEEPPEEKPTEASQPASENVFNPPKELEDFFADIDAEDENERLSQESAEPETISEPVQRKSILKETPPTAEKNILRHQEEEIDESDIDAAIALAAEQVPNSTTGILLQEQELAKREKSVDRLEAQLAERENIFLEKSRNLQSNSFENQLKKLQEEQQDLENQLSSLIDQRQTVKKFHDTALALLEKLQ